MPGPDHTHGKGSMVSTDQTVELSVIGYNGALIHLGGTWTGTVTFEGMGDGVNWDTVIGLKASEAVAAAVTTSANGMYKVQCAGMSRVRARFSTASSGTVTVYIRATTGYMGPLVAGSGGGGGGAVTEADGANAALGTTTDPKTVGDTTGTLISKARGLSTILNDVWDSVNHWLKVSVSNATLAVTQSGSWVLSAGAALIGKVGIDQTTPGTTDSVTVSTAQGQGATVGLAADAGVAAGAAGTLSAKLRAISRDLVANIVLAAGANTIGKFLIDTTDTMIGILTETAPATDTASSGLNGRLQRIAQRLTSLISPGLSANVTVTRPSDTTAYTANDVLGPTGGGTSGIDFNLGAISGSVILITSVALERDVAAVIAGETSYNLYLYNVTPPSALADNAAFDIPSGDRASFLGKISLGVPIDEGSTLYIEQNGVNKEVKLSGTHIFGYLVTVGAYTPASATVLKITLTAEQR